MPLALMALVGTLGFNFQVVIPLLARFTFEGGADRLRAPRRLDGRRLGDRRARRRRSRATSPPADRGRRTRLRHRRARRRRGPEPARRGPPARGPRRRLGHLRRADQLLAPARGRAEDARPRDGPLLDRLPRLDPDRRAAERLARRGRGPARDARHGRRGRAVAAAAGRARLRSSRGARDAGGRADPGGAVQRPAMRDCDRRGGPPRRSRATRSGAEAEAEPLDLLAGLLEDRVGLVEARRRPP